MPTARGSCTTWYGSHEEEEEEHEEYEEDYEEEDSDYDDYNDDDDARFNEWKTNGYMRTPKVFYSWQERVQSRSQDPIMQICIDPKSP